jgi:hypothetical protein
MLEKTQNKLLWKAQNGQRQNEEFIPAQKERKNIFPKSQQVIFNVVDN